jgi:transposase
MGRLAETLPTAFNVSSSLSNVGARQDLRSHPRSGRGRPETTWGHRSERSVHRWHPLGGEKGGSFVGKTRRGKATKIMAMADRNGLPIAIGIASGERHETQLAVETLQHRFLAPVPKRLIGDRAYDSDQLDYEMKRMGVEMISPHRSTRRHPTQDGRPLRRYKRRWHVERLFAWLLSLRRLVTRYEHHAANFLGFAKLGCLVILLRQL